MDERAFTELKYQHEFASGWQVMGRMYYDQYAYDGQFPLDAETRSIRGLWS